MPCKTAEITLNVKGVTLSLFYRNENNGERTYIVNGKKYPTDEKGIYLSDIILDTKEVKIEVVD